MKKRILKAALILSIATASFSTAFAQATRTTDQNPFATEEVKEAYELKTIKATPANGKVYINWTVTDATGKCVYVVERSGDGINYEKVYAKKGAPSPGSNSLMFSFIDEKPLQGKSYYRVQRVGLNGPAYTSTVDVNSTPTAGNASVTTSSLASNK